MDGTSTSAMLVDTPPMLASQPDGLTVTVPRDEIEAALTSDPPSELALDILRMIEGTDAPERRTVKVAWKRTDLESVLEDADAEAITFSFDAAELTRLLAEPDVEGHGIREAAVVLSIAAAAAVGGAASASAANHEEASFTARGITPAAVAATHDEASFTARGIEPTSPADTVTVSSGSSFELPSLGPGMAAGIIAALGAFGLAIVGASFVSRRREPGAA